MVLFLSSLGLCFFFYQGISPAFDFSTSKGFSNSGAFKDFRNFFIETLGCVWIQFCQIKEKSIFSASEGGK